MSEIKVIEFQSEHIQQAKEIIAYAVFEFQIVPCATLQEARDFCVDELSDLDHVPELYFNSNGLLLVMVDGETVVGMGGFQKLDNNICELRRMFFAKEYRGRGLATKMMQVLIDKAKEFGYKKMRLDIYNPSTQIAAVKLYKKMGFYEIPPYKVCRAGLYMERKLIKMRKFFYNKLCRDKIPQILEKVGSIVHIKKLTDAEYDAQLRVKLQEEAEEVIHTKSKKELIEELADVYEVIDALCVLQNISLQDIRHVQEKKLAERGGFYERTYVTTVEHIEGSRGEKYCMAQPEKYPEVTE